ncbi:DUF2442 domain-containing protein [Ottowia pentelensis]|uniref:DUF2442 domain-containing protein n=1 Tax=Ottowia pentelensis TaxID=511108 RepID=A0ABV6PPE1_9BURK
MIKLLNAKPLASHQLELSFSDGTQGVFNGAAYLATRSGPLLEALRDPAYFARCFIEAGGLCWPNGLELPAARLKELSEVEQTT